MGCMYSVDEMVNGNPSGCTNSKDEKNIKKLDPNRMKYINGKQMHTVSINTTVNACVSYSSCMLTRLRWRKMAQDISYSVTQKCTDLYNNRKELRDWINYFLISRLWLID